MRFIGCLVFQVLAQERAVVNKIKVSWDFSSELNLHLPSVGTLPTAVTQSKILSHVQKAWDAVVGSNPVGLVDPRHQHDPILTSAEAYHHFQAAQNGVVDSARFLVAFGVMVSLQSGGTALHNAASLGQLDYMKQLLSDPEFIHVDVETHKDLDGTTCLHSAIMTNQLEIVKYLVLEAGANIEAKGYNGVTPLQLAAALGFSKIVKFLIHEGLASVDTAHAFAGTTALHFAAEMGHVDVIELLCAQGADANAPKTGGSTPLHVAVDSNKTASIRTLIRFCGADPHKLLAGDTGPLYLAAQRGLTNICKVLIEEFHLNPSLEMPKAKNTANYIANIDKTHEPLFYTVKNTEVGNGATPLHISVENGHLETVKYLIEQGAIQTNSMQGSTPLILALQYRHPNIALFLLEQPDPLINYKVPADGSSALMVAVDLSKNQPMLYEKILKSILGFPNVDIDIDNNQGVTPLAHAILQNDPRTVNILLNHNADVYASSPNAVARLAHAGLSCLATTKRLLSLYKPNHQEDAQLVHIAAGQGRSSIIRLLFPNNINVLTRTTGATPLMMAAQSGHLQTARMLIQEFHADLNLKSSETLFGATALYVACEGNHSNVVKLLLTHGADPNIQLNEPYGATCLHAASEKGYANVLAALLDDERTNLELATSNEYTALVLAIMSSHLHIVKLLVDHNANVHVTVRDPFDSDLIPLFTFALGAPFVDFETLEFLSEYDNCPDEDAFHLQLICLMRLQTSARRARPLEMIVQILDRLLLHKYPLYSLPDTLLYIISHVPENAAMLLDTFMKSPQWKITNTAKLFLFSDAMGENCLSIATKHQDVEVVKRLIVGHETEKHVFHKALEIARSMRNFELIKLLSEQC